MNRHFKFCTWLFLSLQTVLFSQSIEKKGWVVSDHYLASEVGIRILKKGGNAIDASIATAFALAVTHPQAGNIGGGGFMVIRTHDGLVNTIDFREKAPLAASHNMFLNKDGTLTQGTNHNGLQTVGVPGTVAGLYLAHQKYGCLSWSELVHPSIKLAKDGFPISKALFDWAKKMEEWPETKSFVKTFFRDSNGAILSVGSIWKQEALAQTLTHIRDKGQQGFYEGMVAQEIETYMKNNGGMITKEDLKKYKAIERLPLKGTFKGFDIYTMPPPSSGGVALIQMMNMIEQANLNVNKVDSPQTIHLLTEIMRRAFADRAEHLGDPDFNENMPIDKLISKDFAQIRMSNLDPKKASMSSPSKYGQLYDGNNTTHFSVLDKEGNAVSLTYTLEQSFGSGMGSPKLGFIFNNEMGDFNPKPGETNEKGQIGTPANIIAPEKRMLSSMTPVIVVKDDLPYLIIGSPGGRTIINTVFQTIVNVLEYQMSIKEAIEAIKIHHQWLPNTLIFEEGRLSKKTQKKLKSMGHQLDTRKNLGRLMGIQFLSDKNTYIGASDSSSPDGNAAFH